MVTVKALMIDIHLPDDTPVYRLPANRYVDYDGIRWPVWNIEGFDVAGADLQDYLIDRDSGTYTSPGAEEVDEGIAYYASRNETVGNVADVLVDKNNENNENNEENEQ